MPRVTRKTFRSNHTSLDTEKVENCVKMMVDQNNKSALVQAKPETLIIGNSNVKNHLQGKDCETSTQFAKTSH